MLWFDTHAHLSDPRFDADREIVINRAFEILEGIIEVADGPSEWEKSKRLSLEHQGKIWWAGGIHPYFSGDVNDTHIKTLQTFAQDPLFVAVGEIGLDYHKCSVEKETQLRVFKKSIEAALKIKKPLIIHCRDAYLDLRAVLHSFYDAQHDPLTPSPGVAHCFSGNLEDALDLIKMGFFIGVDGPVTYPSAGHLRKILTQIPLSQLVIETDSPYLPPQNFRGQRNEPSYLPKIAEMVAQILKISPETLSLKFHENTTRLFRLN